MNCKIEELFAPIPKPSDLDDIKVIKDMIKHYRGTHIRGLEDETPEVGCITVTNRIQFACLFQDETMQYIKMDYKTTIFLVALVTWISRIMPSANSMLVIGFQSPKY